LKHSHKGFGWSPWRQKQVEQKLFLRPFSFLQKEIGN